MDIIMGITIVVCGALIAVLLAIVFFGIAGKVSGNPKTDIKKSKSSKINVKACMENDEFYQQFQPFVSAKSGKIIGCEALTRLRGKDGNVIMPSDFLPIIESEKLGTEFDLYVYKSCCKWAVSRKKENLFITCNFSRGTLSEKDIVDKIKNINDNLGVPYNTTAIEIIEDCINGNADMLYSNIRKLKKHGFKICLDDFGKDYTSLRDISAFLPNVIKLDKSILSAADAGHGKLILENLVSMAKQIGAYVLCEGVETETQVRIAKECGCDIFQGFYYYKPMDSDLFDKLLKENEI